MFSPFYDEKFANLQETFNTGMPILEKRTIGLIIRFSRIAYGQSKQPTNVCVCVSIHTYMYVYLERERERISCGENPKPEATTLVSFP